MNGDGSKEVVLITKGLSLQVCVAECARNASVLTCRCVKIISGDLPDNWIEGIYSPKVLATKKLYPLGIQTVCI